MSWSPAQYTQFESERNRPCQDLLARIPNATVAKAADLGCGPGNSTQLLQTQFPGANLGGFDSSPEMIAAARQRMPGSHFEVADIEKWSTHYRFDVILANASLQWVPDHATLLPRLVEHLAPGGSLAVQIPDNLDEPVHQLMRALAADAAWAEKLAGASERSAHRHSAQWYHQTLGELGTKVDVWRTTYYHALEGGAEAIVEWFKGTALRPYLGPLDEGERETFLSRYTESIAQAYPALPDSSVLLPFPRLFFVATRQ
jgi:trans-aconitate 2-methyltransferase